MNSRMRRLLPEQPADLRDADFPEELQAIVATGWMLGPAETLLLAALFGEGWSGQVDPSAPGLFEYEVNDVHIPTADLAADLDAYMERAARRGVSFALRGLGDAAAFPAAADLVATVATGVAEDFLLHGTTVKFFTRRGDFPNWFDDDLEKFEMEAIAVLTNADVTRS
jgi:hypothetical protein